MNLFLYLFSSFLFVIAGPGIPKKGNISHAKQFPSKMINGIRFSHTTLYVEDLRTSTQFYREVMTLEPISEPFHDQKHSWFSLGPHNQLHVVQGAQTKIAHDINIHLAFSVDNLPAFMEHLKKMNIPFGDWAGHSEKIVKRPDGVEQIYLQDPDGYWIEVNNDRG